MCHAVTNGAGGRVRIQGGRRKFADPFPSRHHSVTQTVAYSEDTDFSGVWGGFRPHPGFLMAGSLDRFLSRRVRRYPGIGPEGPLAEEARD